MKRSVSDFTKPITIIALIIIALLVGTSLWHVCEYDVERQVVRNISGRYHPVSLEGMACVVDGVGIAFDSLNVRKMKSGGITFGGFNMLEIKNLCLTLHDHREKKIGTSEKVASKSASKSLVLPSTMEDPITTVKSLMPQGLKVAGVRIAGLRILKANGDGKPEPWLEARELRNRGRELRLAKLMMTTNGVQRMLGDARLIIKNGYFIECGNNKLMRIL